MQNKDLHTTQLFMMYSDKSAPNMYIISTKDFKIGTRIMLSILCRGDNNRSLFINAMVVKRQAIAPTHCTAAASAHWLLWTHGKTDSFLAV